MVNPFSPKRQRSISNFTYSLARNTTQHSMKNLAFHSLLRWMMNILEILTNSLNAFLLKTLEVCTSLRVKTKQTVNQSECFSQQSCYCTQPIRKEAPDSCFSTPFSHLCLDQRCSAWRSRDSSDHWNFVTILNLLFLYDMYEAYSIGARLESSWIRQVYRSFWLLDWFRAHKRKHHLCRMADQNPTFHLGTSTCLPPQGCIRANIQTSPTRRVGKRFRPSERWRRTRGWSRRLNKPVGEGDEGKPDKKRKPQ